MLLCFSDTRRTDASILVYKFRPERTGFNMYEDNTRPQLTKLVYTVYCTLYTVLDREMI